MEKFFSGRDVKLLSDEKETPGIYVWKLNLEEAEIGHMSCRMDDGVTFLYLERGKLLCQINQERISLRAGEGMFVNSQNAYRFVSGQKDGCGLYVIYIAAEYLQRDQGICKKYVKPLILEEELPYIKLINTGSSEEEPMNVEAAETVPENAKLSDAKPSRSSAEKRKQSEKKLPEIVLCEAQGKGLLDQLRLIQELVSEHQEGYELLLASKIFEIWRELYLGWKQLPEEAGKFGVREKKKLCRMLLFLHEHYREKITLAQMAVDSEVSTGEYCRFFKKKMQQTPVEYLQCYRVERTLSQLLKKDRTEGIGEIALEHGFAGASYYSEIFKKEMGCAPGDYRRWYDGETDAACPLKPVKSWK